MDLVEPMAVAEGAAVGTDPRPDRWGRWGDLWSVVFLVLLAGAWFSPIIRYDATYSTVAGHQGAVFPWAATPTGFHDPPQSDQADLSYPWQTLLTSAVKQGTLPFWDPYSYGGGYPLYANGSSAQLYPPHLVLAAIVSPAVAHDLFCAFHLAGGGIAMFFLMRLFRARRLGSCLAAVAWMFASGNLAWMQLEVVTPMILYLPLGLLTVRWAHERRSALAWTLVSLTSAATLVSGHLLFMGLTWGIAAVYLAALELRRAWPLRRTAHPLAALRSLGPAVGALLLGFGIAAVVLLPTLVALRSSQRDPFSYHELITSAISSPSDFLHVFVPSATPIGAPEMNTTMTFVGTATVLLAFVGLFRKGPGRTFAIVLGLVLFLVAVGTPATWLAYHLVPAMNVFRPYSRFTLWWVFAIAVLGGLGLDRALEAAHRRVDPRTRLGLVASTVAVSLLGVTSVQLFRYGRETNPPFQPRTSALLYPTTPLIGAIQTATAPTSTLGRYVPLRRREPGDPPYTTPVLYAAEGDVHALPSMSGYDSALPRRTANVVRALTGEPEADILAHGLPAAYIPSFLSTTVRWDLLGRLGVDLVVTPPSLPASSPSWGGPSRQPAREQVLYEGADGGLTRLTDLNPGPWLIGQVETVPSETAAFSRFLSAGFDPARSVILEAGQAARLGTATTQKCSGDVGQVKLGLNTAEVDVHTTAPCLLVLAVNWDAGWQGTVGKRSTPVLRGNYNQIVVAVPAGTSQVRLRYRPVGFIAGLAVSALSLAIAAAACAAARARRALRPVVARR